MDEKLRWRECLCVNSLSWLLVINVKTVKFITGCTPKANNDTYKTANIFLTADSYKLT